ncbi:MAG TPA: hypothetical protein VGX25_06850 [Actinophytocola sp.]|uniref:hypothetical protein n=1 Tax=Actinophytocola sp. TaxID=1872138 RepID=UPI002DDD9495|nr:hypothetical protein [Actinophytocola sp.]HEV2779107.1 hypothetical protein [Actinophytocola sp.]
MSDQDNSAYEIVERFWPYDGPHSSDTVTDAATAVGQLVRYMNNATWNPRLLNGPSLYRVLSSLNSAAYGLDQLLEQLAEAARTLAGDSTMYDDRRDRPASATALELAEAITAARRAFAGVPRREVERAAGLACHLGHDSVRDA